MIKTSKHTVKFSNHNKRNSIKSFLSHYRYAVQQYVDFLWSNSYSYGNKILDISKNQLDCPSFLDYNIISFTTPLSARAKNSASTQACGMIKAALEKQRRRLYKLNELTKQGSLTTNLQNKINQTKLVKPTLPVDFKAELSSKNAVLLSTTNHFNYFLKLSSLGKDFGTICIPIKSHRHSNKLKSNGKVMGSFLISTNTIDLRWDIPKPKKRVKGITLGADQGLKTTLTFSNGTITQQQDIHGHSLESICKKLSKKRGGSKAFEKTQQHRKNFINWSINQLNFNNIKQINLENIININYRRNTSRLLKHWTNTLIRDKLITVSETEGFQINLQSSTYRSQRCSSCGMVRKSNRKGKVYKCGGCGLVIDADLNAAKNHAITLPDTNDLCKLNLNHKGFYWLEAGLFTLTGEELRVPLSK